MESKKHKILTWLQMACACLIAIVLGYGIDTAIAKPETKTSTLIRTYKGSSTYERFQADANRLIGQGWTVQHIESYGESSSDRSDRDLILIYTKTH